MYKKPCDNYCYYCTGVCGVTAATVHVYGVAGVVVFVIVTVFAPSKEVIVTVVPFAESIKYLSKDALMSLFANILESIGPSVVVVVILEAK